MNTITYHKFFCISPDFEELCDSVDKPLVVKIAHLLNLTVMISYPGIQLLHEAHVGIWLVIVNGSGTENDNYTDNY